MNEENKGVETNLDQQAPVDNVAVETAGDSAANHQTVEPSVTLSEYEALQERLAKVEQERENYRKGMLAAKGKKVEDDDIEIYSDTPKIPEETIAEIVRKELAAKELDSEHKKLLKQKEDLLQKVLRENEELRLATIAKTKATAPISTGGSSVREETTASFWTPEQEAALKAKGLDPEKVRENYVKYHSGK